MPVDCLSSAVRQVRLECLLNHPYEGGHTDHGAAARLSANVSHADGQLSVLDVSSYQIGTQLEAFATWRKLATPRLGSGGHAPPSPQLRLIWWLLWCTKARSGIR